MSNDRGESPRQPERGREGEEKLRFTKETLADLDAKELEKDGDAVKGGAARGCPTGSGCVEGCTFTGPG